MGKKTSMGVKPDSKQWVCFKIKYYSYCVLYSKLEKFYIFVKTRKHFFFIMYIYIKCFD